MTKHHTNKANIAPRLLGKRDAAAYCGCKLALFSAHVIPFVSPIYLGRSARWDRVALDRWLDSLSGLDVSSANDQQETELQRYKRRKKRVNRVA